MDIHFSAISPLDARADPHSGIGIKRRLRRQIQRGPAAVIRVDLEAIGGDVRLDTANLFILTDQSISARHVACILEFWSTDSSCSDDSMKITFLRDIKGERTLRTSTNYPVTADDVHRAAQNLFKEEFPPPSTPATQERLLRQV